MKKSLLMLLITFACTQATTVDVEPVPNDPFATGAEPSSFSFSPKGNFAAVSNRDDASITSYTVNPNTGELSTVGTFPVAPITNTFPRPRFIAFSPDSRFLACSNQDSPPGTGSVSMFSVDQENGALTLVGSPFMVTAIEQLVFSPDGHFLAVAGLGSNRKIFVFSVNQMTGVLTSVGEFDTIESGFGNDSVDYSPDGKFLACTFASSSATNFQIFSVNKSTGALTSIGGFSTLGSLPRGVSYAPKGGFFAIVNQESNTVSVFSYDENTGVPTIINSPFPTNGSRSTGISYSPNNFYLGVSNFLSNDLTIFKVEADGSLTQLGAPVAVGDGPFRNPSFYFNGVFVGNNNLSDNTISVSRLNITELGSDTQVELIPHGPTLSNGDRIATFAVLDDGFALADEDTKVTYNSTFPVRGDVSLEGGTLILESDLILVDDGRIESMGTIDGQDHTLALAPGTSLVPQPLAGVLTRAVSTAPCFEWGDMTLTLNSDVTFEDTCITFTGNSVINGQGHVLTIGDNSTFQIGQNSTLLMTNVIVAGIETGKVVPLDATSILTLQNTEWLLDDNYSFALGTLDIEKQVTISGNGLEFTYASDQISVIGKNARLQLNNGLIFNYDPSAGPDRLQLLTNNSTIFLNGATLQASDVGLQLIKGILQVGRKSFVSSAGSDMATGIRFGDGMDSANNLTIDILPAAQLELLDGFIVENNA